MEILSQITIGAIALVVSLSVIKYRRFLYIVIVTFPRDISGIYIYIKMNLFTIYCKYTNKTAYKLFDIQTKKRRNKPCFYFEEEIWTFDKVQRESYKVANYFHSKGFRKGDTIALFMGNRPDYVCIWLGLSRIGVTTSLVNYNVRLKSLEHCIQASNSKALIYGSEFTSVVKDVIEIGNLNNVPLFCLQDRIQEKDFGYQKSSLFFTDLTLELSSALDTCPEDFGVQSSDVILNIYTSGTSGIPKAVIMTNSRLLTFAAMAPTLNLHPDKDVLLTALPLYHIQGGVAGVLTALVHGVPQVIIKKFSASNFWSQCIKYNATITQYLGEIIRYLYNQPERPEDKLHKVRIVLGNGVNPAIWQSFKERFNNIKIIEVYGATEGNCTIANLTGHVGACGYIPIWAYPFLPFILAKIDPISGDYIRNSKTGLVVKAKFGECGEVMSEIDNYNPYREFNGYTDKSATQKKIVKNVKNKGDIYFRSGDLVLIDEYGFVYFKDRTGDTFRWKGENVSTAEVEEVITRGSGMKACAVYGVQVPGTEGKCGMAAITDPEASLNLSLLHQEIVKCLPSYARPMFVRVIYTELDMTGTYKISKVDLQIQGFNIEEISDPIYFFHKESYVLLNKELYSDILKGNVKF